MRIQWHGVFTALVTPFHQDDSLNEKKLAELVKRQIDAGIYGLIPCGTTGESPALTEVEWEKVVSITVESTKKKAWVVAGTGTNNTAHSIERTRFAKEAGADGALVITPYYNKPTPDGLYRHFAAIADAVPDLPIMVYNVPGRTGLNLTPDTLEKLMQIPTIVAVKEASGNLAQIWEVAARFSAEIAVFSGDDGLNLPIWDVGGIGTVSVLSNLVPDKVVAQWEAVSTGQYEEAYNLHKSFQPLCRSLFAESSPGPAKWAMNRLGLGVGEVRPPLAPVRQPTEQLLQSDLKAIGLIE